MRQPEVSTSYLPVILRAACPGSSIFQTPSMLSIIHCTSGTSEPSTIPEKINAPATLITRVSSIASNLLSVKEKRRHCGPNNSQNLCQIRVQKQGAGDPEKVRPEILVPAYGDTAAGEDAERRETKPDDLALVLML